LLLDERPRSGNCSFFFKIVGGIVILSPANTKTPGISPYHRRGDRRRIRRRRREAVPMRQR
jgi:hypothetical protein